MRGNSTTAKNEDLRQHRAKMRESRMSNEFYRHHRCRTQG
ncbi:hypothetical protein SOVF_026960 [Spinacia oleracea]|nr:hypothetical protein SOVF_026960 [Spinacia oleracea]